MLQRRVGVTAALLLDVLQSSELREMQELILAQQQTSRGCEWETEAQQNRHVGSACICPCTILCLHTCHTYAHIIAGE